MRSHDLKSLSAMHAIGALLMGVIHHAVFAVCDRRRRLEGDRNA
jgi:hypothetical protein